MKCSYTDMLGLKILAGNILLCCAVNNMLQLLQKLAANGK